LASGEYVAVVCQLGTTASVGVELNVTSSRPPIVTSVNAEIIAKSANLRTEFMSSSISGREGAQLWGKEFVT
jgi:hypothetical protein